MSDSDNEYYVTHREEIMEDFARLVSTAGTAGEVHLGRETTRELAQMARVEFERILPTLPHVGGDKSPFTKMVIQSGETIAFYNACKHIGIDARKIGEHVYRIAEAQVNSVSPVKKWVARRLMFSNRMKNHWRTSMDESQKREYPENWVGSYVPGDSKSFEFGLDFTECAFLKLADRFGCKEIAPYVCLCDFARMRGIGVGFRRTTTLALGHEKCDFRFVKNYETPCGWPLENLEEYRHRPG